MLNEQNAMLSYLKLINHQMLLLNFCGRSMHKLKETGQFVELIMITLCSGNHFFSNQLCADAADLNSGELYSSDSLYA